MITTRVNLPGVVAVSPSGNAKVGDAAVTYSSQATCPPTCPLRGKGCYAENGNLAFVTRRVNVETNPHVTTRNEATAIRALPGNLPLRLKGVGDASDNWQARTLSLAADEYRQHKGQPVWSYTHAWRTVERRNWGDVSILASCESLSDVAAAHAKGYATALVVAEHTSDKAQPVWSYNLLPCPNQTRGVTCTDCRLCFRDKWLRKSRTVITFAAHGMRKNTVKKVVAP